MNLAAITKLTISMAIFGSIGFFTINTGIPAIELVFIRCICATLILSGIWALTGGYKTERWSKNTLLRTMVCGVFLVLNWVFLFKAFEVMSISIAISLYNLAPIFVLLIGTFFLRERITFIGILATTICFIGSILIVGVDYFKSMDALFSSGFIWAILSALCYALTMLTSRTIKDISSYALTFIQTAVGIVILGPLCDFTLFQNLTTSNWLYILGTGIIHTGFVYYLFFDSVRVLPTMLISVLVFVDPVVAILLDVVLLDFVPSTLQIVGIVLIFGSIVCTVFMPQKKHEEHST